MALPFDVRDLMKSGSRLQEDRQQPVSLAILIEADADDTLIDAIRDRLRPNTSGASLQVEVCTETTGIALRPADVVIGVAGSGGRGLAETLATARSAQMPVVVLALRDDAARTQLADTLMQPLADLIIGEDAVAITERLATWLADEIGSKRLALAHNFAFMRRAVAGEAVRATAMQNALVGAVAFIPGADMPIMTANQAKMLLQIAAAYGEKLGAERLRELAAVVGGAFVFRTVAREMLGLVPVLGWAVKGGIGYAGTMAMGKAAIEYFEDGADLAEVARRLREGAGEVVQRVPRPGKKPPALIAGRPEPAQPELPGLVAAEVGPAGE